MSGLKQSILVGQGFPAWNDDAGISPDLGRFHELSGLLLGFGYAAVSVMVVCFLWKRKVNSLQGVGWLLAAVLVSTAMAQLLQVFVPAGLNSSWHLLLNGWNLILSWVTAGALLWTFFRVSSQTVAVPRGSGSPAAKRKPSDWSRLEDAHRSASAMSTELQARFRATFEQAAVGIAHVAPDGKWLRVNDTFCRIAGYERDALMQSTFQDITHPDDLDADLDFVRQLLAGEIDHYSMEKRYIRKDGEVVWILLTVAFVQEDGDTPYFISVIQDLGNLKRVEAELRASEQRLETAIENAPLPIIFHADDGEIIRLNRPWQELSGYSHAELPTIKHWIRAAYRKDRPDVLAHVQELFNTDGPVKEGEFKIRTKENRRRIWDFTSSHLGEMADGRQLVMSMAIDVTARHRQARKIRERNHALQEANKDLQYFAYVASHDLQEPLRSISGYVQLLQKRYSEQFDERAQHYMQRSIDATKRMQQLISDLLSYTRITTHGNGLKPVDMDLICTQAVEDISNLVKRNNAKVYWDSLPTVLGDATQLKQVLQNLIGNALKYHGAAPPEVQISAEALSNVSESLEQDYWRFTVRDNGIGIEEQYLDRIFEVFQRLHTREEYDGTGIGLAICRRIIDRHGGKIWAHSEVGQGTSFLFTVPVEKGGEE